jgi:hypothetical protein
MFAYWAPPPANMNTALRELAGASAVTNRSRSPPPSSTLIASAASLAMTNARLRNARLPTANV